MMSLAEDWREFASQHVQFARMLNRESSREHCKLWRLGDNAGPVPAIPKWPPGKLWWAWQKEQPGLACAIEIGPIARGMIAPLNDQREWLMSRLLAADTKEREAIIGAKYPLPFRYLLKRISYANKPLNIALKRCEVSPKFYLFEVETENDGYEAIAQESVLLLYGARPKFKVVA